MYSKITKKDFILKAIKNKLPLDLSWIIGILSIPISGNGYVSIIDKEYIVLMDDEEYILTDADIKFPIFVLDEEIDLQKGYLSIIKEDINTTIGLLLLNYLFLEYGLEGKIDFINKEFTFKDIEKEYILPKLVEDKDEGPDNVSIRLYKKVTSVVTFIRNFVPVVVTSATEKTITPPTGIKEFKAKTIKEYKDKYGPDVLDDETRVLEIEEKLLEFDKEYLKDDPTLGLATSKKIIGSSRKKKYLIIGPQSTMVEKSSTPSVADSLLEGMPKDPEAISAIINGLRSGSFSRGFETKTSGLVAKYLIRATHGFKIKEKDCGSKLGIDIVMTKEIASYMVGNYKIDGGKITNITEELSKSLIGKKISIRSPQYCKTDGDAYCKICAGDTLARTENGVGLLAIGLGGKALSASLAKFHHKSLGLYKLSLEEFIK